MPQSDCIAIIAARGGSKRIPRKNVRHFLGRPIIAYSIEAALRSNRFKTVMVSTDDQEIAEIATNHGAEVPFFRSKEKSGDFSILADVVEEVLAEYESLGLSYDAFCCILPTAPFITPEKLTSCWERLNESGADSVLPVVRFGYPILRSLKIENGKLLMNWPEHLTTRSNDLPPAFHDSGQFYWMNTKSFMVQKKLFAENSIGFEIPETECQDIDTEEDWKLAELKYKLLMTQPSSS